MVGADEQLAGYTVLAEWRRPRLVAPKDRDFALGLGPLLRTVDDLGGGGLEAAVRVRGAERLRGRFGGFDWEAARALAAAGTVLRPGDLLAGPAVGAVGDVEAGDTVEIAVDGIGVLGQAVS
jgi:2-keto-4-pentenoate hydratase/2-oxohepta-3-ene-1,7-dioic acid hydratase in catechol pathway